MIIIQISMFREKYKARDNRNLVICLYEGFQIFLDRIDIVNTYPAKST